MARQPTGTNRDIQHAQEMMRLARTAEELRAAQAVLLPLLGHSLADAAKIIGKSRHWVSRVRNGVLRGEAPPSRHGGRRNAILRLPEEDALVRAAIEQSDSYPWKPLRETIREGLDRAQGQPVSESTVTELLDRAAKRLLKSDEARGTDLVQTSFWFAQLWRAQQNINRRVARAYPVIVAR